MDIDDHLPGHGTRSLRRDELPSDDLDRILRAGSTRADEDTFDEDEGLLEKLTRLWMDERNAPDILMWQGLMVEEVLDKLQAQVRSAPSCFFSILVRVVDS